VHVQVASTTTPGFLVTVDYIHVFTSSLVLLSCQQPDSGCRSALGYSVCQTLPSLFPPPLSLPTNYQTEGSGARLERGSRSFHLQKRCIHVLNDRLRQWLWLRLSAPLFLSTQQQCYLLLHCAVLYSHGLLLHTQYCIQLAGHTHPVPLTRANINT